MTAEEAKRQAPTKFGNPLSRSRGALAAKHDSLCRETWPRSEACGTHFGGTPGFSLIAIGVMALCIGAATSLFTVVRSVLLRPLPFVILTSW